MNAPLSALLLSVALAAPPAFAGGGSFGEEAGVSPSVSAAAAAGAALQLYGQSANGVDLMHAVAAIKGVDLKAPEVRRVLLPRVLVLMDHLKVPNPPPGVIQRFDPQSLNASALGLRVLRDQFGAVIDNKQVLGDLAASAARAQSLLKEKDRRALEAKSQAMAQALLTGLRSPSDASAGPSVAGEAGAAKSSLAPAPHRGDVAAILAGHIVLSMLSGRTPESVSLTASARSRGYVQAPAIEGKLETVEELRNRLVTTLGGLAAEDVMGVPGKERSTASSSSLDYAHHLALEIASREGDGSASRAEEVFRQALARARFNLSQNKEEMKALVHTMLEHDGLTTAEIETIIKSTRERSGVRRSVAAVMAGQALLEAEAGRVPEKVSMVPSEGASAYLEPQAADASRMETVADLQSRLITVMGARAAEEILGIPIQARMADPSAQAAARHIAMEIVSRRGKAEEGVPAVMESALAQAKALLFQNKEKLAALTRLLVTRDVVTGEEIRDVLR